MVSKITLGQEHQKYVIVSLSSGEKRLLAEVWFRPDGSETRHKEIVDRFCRENGFTPTRLVDGITYQAENNEGIALEVRGGGIIRLGKVGKEVYVSEDSIDYGMPHADDVIPRIMEAARMGGLTGFQVSFSDLKGLPKPKPGARPSERALKLTIE